MSTYKFDLTAGASAKLTVEISRLFASSWKCDPGFFVSRGGGVAWRGRDLELEYGEPPNTAAAGILRIPSGGLDEASIDTTGLLEVKAGINASGVGIWKLTARY